MIEEDKENRCIEVIKKYFIETSIHGLKYIFENGRHFLERLFWILACCFLWSIGFYLIYLIIDKWQTSPVLVSFDSTVTPIWAIPFPALTICNMNKVRKSRVDFVQAQKAAQPTEEKWHHELLFVEEVCESQAKTAQSSPEASNEEEIKISGHEIHAYLSEMAHSCDKMILRCHFAGHERNCSNIFRPIITDEGQCCTFNLAPDSIMFRKELLNEENHSSEEETKKWSRWNPQSGYLDDLTVVQINEGDDVEEKLAAEQMPRRSLAPGRHSGLTLLLNVEKDEYFCSGTESVGLKGLLHMPASNPELVEYGFALSPGTENFMPIKPEIIHADEAIMDIHHSKRACFMQDEKYLRYFNTYAFLNCMSECTSNFTFASCGCVAYYMPRDENSMPICPPSKADCVEEAIEKVETTAYDPASPVGDCECIPACTEMKYPFTLSTAKISRAKGLHASSELKTAIPKLNDDQYVEDNIALLHVYHEDLHFLKHQRGELFSVVDLFSYVGGVLGLCLGFSAMSALECLYFFTLRLGLNIYHKRDEPDVVGSLFEN